MGKTADGLILALLLTAPAGAKVALTKENVPSPEALISPLGPVKPNDKMPYFPEHLEFEVKWGVFAMGSATLEVQEMVSFNGEPAYRIVSKAQTAPFADKIYKVRDHNESWVRASDFTSLGYLKQLREGTFFRDEWVLYDYDNKKWLSKKVNRDGAFEYSSGELLGQVQDILSSLHSIRPHPLNVGDEVVLDVNTKQTWPLVIKVHRKQTIRTPAGTFKTILVEPMLRDEGIFIQKGKRLQVWLTDDKRHMPVLMKVEIIFGDIACYLRKYGERP